MHDPSPDALWNRRRFLTAAGLSTVPLLAPSLLSDGLSIDGLRVWAGTNDDQAEKPEHRWDRILVLVELAGGNDGLNTVIPTENDDYYRLRPKLGIRAKDALRLRPGTGLHSALAPLQSTWDAGDLAIVQGVGYPSPNRSHFRSIEIWETGSKSDEFRTHGWLTSLLGRASLPSDHAADGIVVGDSDPGPLAGETLRTISMDNPAAFIAQAKRLAEAANAGSNPALQHLTSVQAQTRRAASIIEARLKETPAPKTPFPNTRLGRQLATTARLLVSGVPTRVVKVTHGGFDTHTNQAGTHRRLLAQLGAGLAALEKTLRRANLWDRVLVMTYSEFGRRVAENGSAGTDHGTAAPHFLAGGKVKGGLYGEAPSLTDLDRGDLRFGVDYHRLYSTVARWWNLPAAWIENGAHEPVDLLEKS